MQARGQLKAVAAAVAAVVAAVVAAAVAAWVAAAVRAEPQLCSDPAQARVRPIMLDLTRTQRWYFDQDSSFREVAHGIVTMSVIAITFVSTILLRKA